MNNALITIATFDYGHELQILKSILESEGIQCFTKDENTVNTDPLVTFAIGGVKLLVNELDLRQALVIKEKYEYRKTGLDESDIDGEYLELKFYAKQQAAPDNFKNRFLRSAIAIVLVFLIAAFGVAYFIAR